MAKAQKNVVVRGINGSIGDLVFRLMPDGETYVSGKPDFSRRKFSKKQEDNQSRFKEAVAYAREAAKTQPIYAELAKGTVKSAYNWALSDWFNPPVIHNIGRRDGRIRVEASDNVRVARVAVSVLDEAGKVMEKGEAIRTEGDWWEYETSANGKVRAEVWDLAGNVVRREF